jgi:hypothetical protein
MAPEPLEVKVDADSWHGTGARWQNATTLTTTLNRGRYD